MVVHVDSFLDENEEIEEPVFVIDLMKKLTESRFEAEFNYDIVFTLGRKASRMLFPLKLPFMAGSVIDEFRGFRGVKRDGRNIAYEVSIDSPALKELYINIEFSRKEVFDSDLLNQTIREAASIVEGIIPASEWSE